MGDVNLEIKLGNLDERVIKIEESGGGSGGDDYITSVSNDFNVVNKKLSLSNDVTTKLSKVDTPDNLSVELAKKIDKPASASDGQVLTYNATSGEWEAQNSKGSNVDLSDVYGSDAYSDTKNYVAGDMCISDNKLWECVTNCIGQIPTEGTYWTQLTLSKVNSSLENLIKIKDFSIDNGNISGNSGNSGTLDISSLNAQKIISVTPIPYNTNLYTSIWEINGVYSIGYAYKNLISSSITTKITIRVSYI